ncbi:MAG: hypothetical protein AAB778_01695 [Patescibacteria group bacterium]
MKKLILYISLLFVVTIPVLLLLIVNDRGYLEFSSAKIGWNNRYSVPNFGFSFDYPSNLDLQLATVDNINVLVRKNNSFIKFIKKVIANNNFLSSI